MGHPPELTLPPRDVVRRRISDDREMRKKQGDSSSSGRTSGRRRSASRSRSARRPDGDSWRTSNIVPHLGIARMRRMTSAAALHALGRRRPQHCRGRAARPCQGAGAGEGPPRGAAPGNVAPPSLPNARPCSQHATVRVLLPGPGWSHPPDALGRLARRRHRPGQSP